MSYPQGPGQPGENPYPQYPGGPPSPARRRQYPQPQYPPTPAYPPQYAQPPYGQQPNPGAIQPTRCPRQGDQRLRKTISNLGAACLVISIVATLLRILRHRRPCAVRYLRLHTRADRRIRPAHARGLVSSIFGLFFGILSLLVTLTDGSACSIRC